MTKYHCIPIYWKKNYYASSPIWDPFIFSHQISCVFLFFWLCYTAYGILVPWQGIEPIPPALENIVLTSGSPGNSLSPDILALSLFCCCSLFLKKCALSLQLYWKHFVFKTCNISLPTSETETTNHFTLQSLAEWLHSDAKCLISEFSCDTQGMTIK